MLLAHVPHQRARRRGAILLIVLTLLALFSVIGLGFVLFAESEAIASRVHKEAFDDVTPFDDLAIMDGYNQQTLNQFATNLIFGGSGQGSDAFSATYGNDLSTSRFVSNKQTPPIPGPSVASGPLVPPVVGPQVGVYSGTGAITSSTDATAVGFGAGFQQPVFLPGGMAVERESIVNFSPIVDQGGGYGVYPEFTGSYTFVPGIVTPMQANGNPYATGTAPQFQSKAAPYTYPDANNLYLAQVRPDTGDLVTPSFHRDYVFGRRLMPGAPTTGNNPQQLNYDTSVNFTTNSLSGLNPNWYTRSGRLRIARPRPWDQLSLGEQQMVATAASLTLPIPETLTTAQAGQMTTIINTLVANGLLPNLMPMPSPNSDGSFTGDVQNLRGNMAMQRNDSIWIYPGGPVLNWRDKRVVAMVAPMILDTSSKANLNVASNFTGFSQTAYPVTNTSNNTTTWNRFSASRSSLGMGPHEINVSRLLRDNTSFTQTNVNTNQINFAVPGEIQRALLIRNGQSQSSASFMPAPATPPSPNQVAPTLLPGQQPILDRYTQSVAVFNKGQYVPAYSPFDLRASVEPVPTAANMGVFTAPSNNVSSTFQMNSPANSPTYMVGGTTTFPSTTNWNQFSNNMPAPAPQLADNAADMLFNPGQWLRVFGTSANGPHQFGPDNDRRLSTRYGLSPNDVFRNSTMSELGTLMPGNMGNFGNPMAISVGGSDSFISNPTEAARAFFTTYSTSMSRPDLPVEIARTPAANGKPLIINRASLSPIDVNRPLGDYRVDANQTLSPLNIFPLDTSMLPAMGLFTSQSNVEAYKTYCVARQSRQNLARDIFVRLAAVTKFSSRPACQDNVLGNGNAVLIDGVEICFDPSTGYLRHFNPTSKAYEMLQPAPLPPAPLPTPLPLPTAPANIYQDRFDALRSIAQVAANMVDYIDNDDIKTSFVWNPVNPLFQDADAADPTATQVPYPIVNANLTTNNNPGTVGANALNRQIDQSANPNPALYLPLPQKGKAAASPPVSQFIDPSADQSNFVVTTGMTAGTPVMDQHVVFGTELPRLLINEALATSQVNNGNGNGNANGNPNRTKKFWVELYNPLPNDSTDTKQQNAVSEGGVARLRYIQSQTPPPPPPAQPTQTSKTSYGPYRMEIFSWPTVAMGQPPTLASLLQQFPGNVTGDLELLFSQATGQPGVPTNSPEIRVDNFANVTGNGMNPPVTQLPQDVNGTTDQYTVKPYGPPNNSNGNGFFVVGPSTDPSAPLNNVTTDTRLKDAPQGSNPNPITPNTVPIAPTQANNFMTISYNINQNGGNGPNNNPNSTHAVVLRRLANPHMQPNPDPNATPPYNPNLPYNPYITVDLMDQIVAVDHTNNGQGNGNNNGPSGSVSRQIPYSASIPSGQFVDRTVMPPNQPVPVPNPGPLTVQQGSHSFRSQNNVNNPVVVDTTGWPPHMDRELVNSLELLFTSSAPPYLMTSNFGKLYQSPFVQGTSTQATEQTSVFWHLNSNTVQTVLSGAQSFAGDTPPPADFSDWPRALDFLTVRSRFTGIPVGGPVPGKVNINTIWDERDDEFAAPPNQPNYTGTAQDPAPPNSSPFPHWRKPMSNRMLKAILDPADGTNMVSRNHFDPSAVAYMWQPSPTSQSSNRMGRTASYPAVSASDQPYQSFSAAFGGSSQTLFRSRADGNPLFYHSTPPQPHNKANVNTVASVQPHPYTRVEPLQKMLNSVTTTSDTFMVIMTVSYFEVRGMDTNVPGMTRPLIGRETFRDMPGDIRKQYMMIVDRSQLSIEDPALVTGGSTSQGAGTRAVPWFTEQLTDAQPGDTRIVVRADTTGGQPAVIRDGVRTPIPSMTWGLPQSSYFDSTGAPLNAIRIGFGDPNAPVKGDGEWAWVLAGPDLAGPTRVVGPTVVGSGAVALTVSTQPWNTTGISATNPLPPGLTNGHAAGTPISNAIHGSPGPRSLIDLNQPTARGVVPFFGEIPR